MAKYVEMYHPPECPREPMGEAPALLAKRPVEKSKAWCPKNTEFDPNSDEDNPKTILAKDVYKAAADIGSELPATPLVRSKCCDQLGMEVHYKLEFMNRTHSFHERAAHYIVKNLTDEQMRDGLFTASLGNWGKALAYKARRYRIPLTVVLPENTATATSETIRSFGATPVLYGKTLSEAKKQAFVLKNEHGCGTYINGYDHPQVITAAGVIGIEILKQLPQTEAILIPIGGGALIAGIAAVVKTRKPQILIYGVEPAKCCCFYKAIENERPYKTHNGYSLARSLAVPIAGWNSYHTAVSLIDKIVLTQDDWITQAILHLAEEEKMVLEGAGAISLSCLLSKPPILPELVGKKVVCILSGGNIDNYTFSRALMRALSIAGRRIKVTVKMGGEDMKMRLQVLSVIANVGVNIISCYTETASVLENDFVNIYLTLICETQSLQHACSLKRVMCRLFPDKCEFLEEPFSPIPICICYPKKRVM